MIVVFAVFTVCLLFVVKKTKAAELKEEVVVNKKVSALLVSTAHFFTKLLMSKLVQKNENVIWELKSWLKVIRELVLDCGTGCSADTILVKVVFIFLDKFI